ncbi:putative glutamate--tRNA ligase, cytoplasmic [Cucumispora dikerogammari]|nr:putative glutamate--tRNA ligase, cytoplasmic [Cucumispora dikerogammari]
MTQNTSRTKKIIINPKAKEDFKIFLIAKKHLKVTIVFSDTKPVLIPTGETDTITDSENGTNSTTDIELIDHINIKNATITKSEVVEEINKRLKNESLKLFLKNMKTLAFNDLKLSLNDLSNFLETVDLKLPENTIAFDYIFADLYSSPIFTNLIKQRNVSDNIFEEYCTFLNLSTKYITEFNDAKSKLEEKCKDQGKFSFPISSTLGPVITRFPPEPSGYLHIGHARAALLNQYFAESNGGKLLVRFDDTNQNKEYAEYEPIILKDLALLGITNYDLSATSDHFEYLIDCCKALINKGLVFCDDTDVVEMRRQREICEPSKNRDVSVVDNMKIFEKLVYQHGLLDTNIFPDSVFCVLHDKPVLNKDLKNFCFRAKIDYKSKNGALRDPVIFRQNLKPHHKTGTKFNLYPTYDFAVPLVDHREGVTFCLRTTEFHDRNAQYEWILNQFGFKGIQIYDFGRLNFENTCLSKRKLKYFIDNKLVSGWDDPRVPTIRGISRLGLSMDTLKEYILMQGAPRKAIEASWDKIWSINKKNIDLNAKRISCVNADDYVTLNFDNESAKLDNLEIPFYKKNVSLGNKKVFTKDLIIAQADAMVLEANEEFTLMNLCNAVVLKKHMSDKKILSIDLKLQPNGDFKSTKNKINFVSLVDYQPVTMIKYGSLIIGTSQTSPNRVNENIEDLSASFNPHSKTETKLIAESALKEIKQGEVCQFERIGFVICDSPGVFNLIPFTEQKRK